MSPNRRWPILAFLVATAWAPAADAASLTADLGAQGLFRYEDGAGWEQLTIWSPEATVVAGQSLFADFGGGRGVWSHDGSWIQTTPWDPYRIEAWGTRLVAAFDAGRGLWLRENGSWRQLTSWEPAEITPGRLRLFVSFGLGRGVWAHDSGWVQLATWDAYDLKTLGESLFAAFDAGRGLWLHEADHWRQLTSWEPVDMVTTADGLYVDFGPGRGLWFYGGSWSQLSAWSPFALQSWGRSLVAAFDAGRGLWLYDSGRWSPLSNWEPTRLTTDGTTLIADFGVGRGLWTYQSSWAQITHFASEGVGPSPSAPVALIEDLTEHQIFPIDNWWNVDIRQAPVSPSSDAFVSWIGNRQLHPDFGPPPYGIPYVTVSASQPLVPVTFVDYPEESDPGAPGEPPGYPIPDEAINTANYIEGGVAGGGSSGDRHLLILDRDRGLLYETWATRYRTSLGRWEAGSGAV